MVQLKPFVGESYKEIVEEANQWLEDTKNGIDFRGIACAPPGGSLYPAVIIAYEVKEIN